jgi:hypothetical protein
MDLDIAWEGLGHIGRGFFMFWLENPHPFDKVGGFPACVGAGCCAT